MSIEREQNYQLAEKIAALFVPPEKVLENVMDIVELMDASSTGGDALREAILKLPKYELMGLPYVKRSDVLEALAAPPLIKQEALREALEKLCEHWEEPGGEESPARGYANEFAAEVREVIRRLAPPPVGMETICVICGHRAGEHWLRAGGIQECGEQDCPCRKFAAIKQEAETPQGTQCCPICGDSEPHSHQPWDVERERYARPIFEMMFKHTLVHNYAGLDPSGTYGWAICWNQRKYKNAPDYFFEQVQTCWRVFQTAWIRRGEMFPEMKSATIQACGQVPAVVAPVGEVIRNLPKKWREEAAEFDKEHGMDGDDLRCCASELEHALAQSAAGTSKQEEKK